MNELRLPPSLLLPSLLLCSALVAACGGTPPVAPVDGGADAGLSLDGGDDAGSSEDGGDEADGGTDGGLPADGGADSGTLADGGVDAGTSAGPWDLPGIDYTVDAGAPITSQNETWTFVPVPEAKCGNGTSTGMAVNLTDRSDRVFIFLAGGGACWEAAACAAGAAVHIQDTMGETAVLNEAQAASLAVLFDRDDTANPFRDASFVYIPYCTGDLHSGTKVYIYDWFGPRPIQHVGARNMDAYLRRLQPTFASADRVWLSGVSAGGFGATFNWWRVQKAFPNARVDVLNDSGDVIDAAGDGRYGSMMSTWGMEFPPGCPNCTTSLGAVLTYSVSTLLEAPRRYALLSYEEDATIGLYFGLSGAEVKSRLTALRASAPENLRTFYLTGNTHVVLSTPNVSTSGGVTARQWVQSFADDNATFSHAGP